VADPRRRHTAVRHVELHQQRRPRIVNYAGETLTAIVVGFLHRASRIIGNRLQQFAHVRPRPSFRVVVRIGGRSSDGGLRNGDLAYRVAPAFFMNASLPCA
jgi:hypothetical protein